MKKYLSGIFYSLPVQLFFLHFRRYQVFLVFWYVFFATVSGFFLKSFGARSLFLAPEYMNKVDFLATALVGLAIGVFIMSWHITTFILHTRHIRFLATTAQPFLKYCINNGILPTLFLLLYFYKALEYNRFQQLISAVEMLKLVAGFLLGLNIAVAAAFFYFYVIDKRVYRRIGKKLSRANKIYTIASRRTSLPPSKGEIRCDWFLSARLRVRKPRDVRHYSEEFLDSIFKRHHIAAIIAVLIAFLFLIGVSFLSGSPYFQIPAAASVAIFFAVLIAVAGAFSLFLKSWSVPLLIAAYFVMNWMYKEHLIDPRNKVYGLVYDKDKREEYTRNAILRMASPENVEADKKQYIEILNNWKRRQGVDKPVMYLVNVSGGGLRSSAFTVDAMQRLDSLTNGEFMKKTFMITGASGGLLGAAYFRELYRMKQHGAGINLQDKQYSDNVSKDLLNTIFSSFVTTDLLAPTQTVTIGGQHYVKDRGYYFEQRFNSNTGGILDKKLGDYAEAERKAEIPLIFFHSVITTDGRQVIIGTHPARFFMRAITDTSNLYAGDPDAVDYLSLFRNNNPYNTRILSALRLNATFPYVLPNVLLPTRPMVDAMDAGLRDNYGLESALRFMHNFKEWLKENTGKVVIVQIRGRRLGEWEATEEGSGNFFGEVTGPIWLLQNNYYKLQDYYLDDQLQYMFSAYGGELHRVNLQYVPSKLEAHASLSYHLTAAEKKDIRRSLDNIGNTREFQRLLDISKPGADSTNESLR
ncbi:MAG TPA: hypothetical protein VF145_00890 [Chitinophagaceae bacterium]